MFKLSLLQKKAATFSISFRMTGERYDRKCKTLKKVFYVDNIPDIYDEIKQVYRTKQSFKVVFTAKYNDLDSSIQLTERQNILR